MPLLNLVVFLFALSLACAVVRFTFFEYFPLQETTAYSAATWPMFIPPLILLFAGVVWAVRFQRLPAWKIAAGLALILVALLLGVPQDVLRQPVTYSPLDDGGQYLAQAQFMFTNHTLMAGTPIFDTQPGYPYFLLLLLFLPGFPNRLYQLLLVFVLVVVVCLSVRSLRRHSEGESKLFTASTTAFPVLAVPYFVKNLYLGLPEWLVFALLFLALIFWARGSLLPCSISLAVLAVLRQNLLVASALLLAVVSDNARRLGRRRGALVFLLLWISIAFAPALHNLYYGGTFRLLAGGRTLTLIGDWTRRPFDMLLETFLKYVGVSPTVEPVGLIFSLVSVPIGTALLVLLLSRTVGEGIVPRTLFPTLVASCVVPAALFGLAYYPRFELVNLSVAHIGYYFISGHSKLGPRNISPSGTEVRGHEAYSPCGS